MKRKKTIYYCITLLICLIIALPIHALLPADVNIAGMDGFLVEKLGFPVVACIYFFVLYLHCMYSMCILGNKGEQSRIAAGLRYGMCFGLIYLGGMIEMNPQSAWSGEELIRQFWVGIGDMVPAVLVCLMTAIAFPRKSKESRRKAGHAVITIGITAAVFFVNRMIRYMTGSISSAYKGYPVPVIVWTACMGIIFGCAAVLILPFFKNEDGKIHYGKMFIGVIGLNWIWFNCFIGLIMKDAFLEMMLRAGIDVAGFGVSAVLIFLLSKVHQKEERGSLK